MKSTQSYTNTQVEKMQIDKIFVISLQNTPGVHESNLGRLDKFSKAWTEACGFAPSFEICDGVYNSHRGYGPTLSFLFCLEKAQFMNINVTVLFEDDARLGERAIDFCHKSYRRENLWRNLPSDTFLAFLGGHSWEYTGKEIRGGSYRFHELSLSFGAYAYAIPHDSLRTLIDMFKGEIVYGHRENGIHQHHDWLSPERAFYIAAKAHNKKIYSIDPLLIWHEGGFSNTWQRERGNITGNENRQSAPMGV